jgi:hypothetical protein
LHQSRTVGRVERVRDQAGLAGRQLPRARDLQKMYGLRLVKIKPLEVVSNSRVDLPISESTGICVSVFLVEEEESVVRSFQLRRDRAARMFPAARSAVTSDIQGAGDAIGIIRQTVCQIVLPAMRLESTFLALQ